MPARFTDVAPSGFLEKYDITVDRSTWKEGEVTDRSGLKKATLSLYWEGTTTDPSYPQAKCFFSCGSNWATYDGGQTCVHAKTGTDELFIKSTGMGKLIARAVDLGITALLEERGGDVAPFQANVWEGLRFSMDVPEEDKSPNAKDTRRQPFPVVFLGVVGQASVPAAGRSAAQAIASSNGGGTSLQEAIENLAREHEDYEAFQAAALKIPGVSSDSGLVAQVVQRDGIWSSIRATV
jgi:hypothetical protein